jgi:predicted RNase H-like nuclease
LTIAGVDGCRRGWVVATRTGVFLASSIAEVIANHDVVGIDMPIGLPPAWGRAADTEARRLLGRRACTVFPTPPRSLLVHTTYADANADARHRYGKGLQRQTWQLVPHIREVDDAMDPSMEGRVAEIHPECAFATLAGVPLPPKRTAEGREGRRSLVRDLFGDVATHVPGAAMHDVLDAYGVLFSAERFARGEHVAMGDGARDERGLVMRIVR